MIVILAWLKFQLTSPSALVGRSSHVGIGGRVFVTKGIEAIEWARQRTRLNMSLCIKDTQH